MKIATVVARVLLGLAFCASGISGFLLISNPPPAPPGLAGVFQDVFFQSRWVLFVDSVELIGGVLLLSKQYVPLALTMLAGVIANIIVFHLTMAPSGLPVAGVLSVLWTINALPYRAIFAPLFVRKPDAQTAEARQQLLQAVA
jgi:putative oxidoreductase